MFGKVSHELEVRVPSSEVWKVYGTLELGKLTPELVPSVMEKVEVISGDGGAGTVLELTLPPEIRGSIPYRETFTKIDNDKRLKVVETIEGGFLEFGFSLYRVTFEIIEKDANSSIIKSIVEYEIDDESSSKAALINTKPFEVIAEAIGKYLIEKKAKTCTA